MASRFFFLLLMGIIGSANLQAKSMRLDPRAHEMFFNPEYAEHIEVKKYLVVREQLVEVFRDPKVQVVQRSSDELYGNPLYLLVRCKNQGKYISFGALYFYVVNGPVIRLRIKSMPPNRQSYDDYVIYLDDDIVPLSDELPKIRYEWDPLYNM